jgi:hypothetical protein
MSEFKSFGKIERYEKIQAVITEKVDGTNACINFTADETNPLLHTLTCQSRNKLIDPFMDNYGFAAWAHANFEDLFDFFGPGRHFGEWWGNGIQRGYGTAERYFSPFNTHLFNWERDDFPDNVSALPLLWQGPIADLDEAVRECMDDLALYGSFTLPGLGWDAEGCMVWSHSTGYMKVPFEKSHKWQEAWV